MDLKSILSVKIIDRFETAGLHLVALKMVRLTQPILDVWYAHHKDKALFPSLSEQMMSTPVVAFIVEGDGAIQKVFDILWAHGPGAGAPGTIRKDFGVDSPTTWSTAPTPPRSGPRNPASSFAQTSFLINIPIMHIPEVLFTVIALGVNQWMLNHSSQAGGNTHASPWVSDAPDCRFYISYM